MGDFSHLSDEELNAMIAAQSGVAPGMDLSSISDAQLDQMITAQGGDYSLLEAGKQFGSGAIEGTAGLFGTLSDLGEMLSPYGHTPGKFSFDRTQQAINTVQPVVAEPNEQYRYSRRMGDFLGPSMVTGGIGKALQLAGKLPQVGSFLRSLSTPSALAADAGGAVVSQAAQDIAPDSTAAPILGAVFGSAGTSTAIQTGKGLRRALGGLNESEIMQSAAYVLQKMGLSPDQIDDALKRLPPDELASLMSTAEVTGNAGMAQLEEYLTQVGVGSGKKVARAAKRADARDAVLDTLSTARKQNVEGLGGDLRAGANAVRTAGQESAEKLWQKFPRHESIDSQQLQAGVRSILDSNQTNVKPRGMTKTLVDQVLESEGVMTSGAMQDIRKFALRELRQSGSLNDLDVRLLNELQGGAETAIKNAGGDLYDIWDKARTATRENAETYARGTAGGKLVNESIEESNLIRRTFTGDKKAVKQLAKAIDNDPSLMERYKAAVIDTVKRNSDGELTKAKVNDFLQKNINGLEELYGTNGVKRIKRVLDDLRSADNVGNLANQASRGQSATQQKLRVAGAIKQMVNSRGGSRVPIIGAILDDLGETAALKSTGGIEALLLEAAFDPVLAKELVKLPTPERMKTALEGLVSYAKKTGTAAGRGAGLAILSEMEPSTRQSQPVRVRPSRPEDLMLSQPQNAGYAQGRGTNNQEMQPLRRPEEAPRGIEQHSASVQPTPTPVPRQPVTASGQVRDVKAFIKQQDPLIQAIIKVESNGDPKAGSHAGAQGLMQLMPQIQKAFNVTDPHDPRQNVAAGIKLLEEEWNRFGDARLALAAYNAGSPAVRKAIKKAGSKSWSQVARFLPRETRNYVPKVLREYKALA